MSAKTNREAREQDTGRPLPEDRWPRIEQAPTQLAGHAHIKGTDVTIQRVLRALAHEGHPVPALLMTKGVREADIIAALHYSADVIENMHRLHAEVQRLHGITGEIAK